MLDVLVLIAAVGRLAATYYRLCAAVRDAVGFAIGAS